MQVGPTKVESAKVQLVDALHRGLTPSPHFVKERVLKVRGAQSQARQRAVGYRINELSSSSATLSPLSTILALCW